MKKGIRILLLLVLLFAVLGILTNCRYLYGSKDYSQQDLRYVAHDFLPVCFASDYSWSADAADAVIDLAEVCQGHFVTSLGGHGADPFLVNLPNSTYSCSESALPGDAQIEQYHLVINLSRNTIRAEHIAMDYYHAMGGNRFVRILVTVNCPEDNPIFYSEEGRLYKRTDDSLVEGFFYASDYGAE